MQFLDFTAGCTQYPLSFKWLIIMQFNSQFLCITSVNTDTDHLILTHILSKFGTVIRGFFMVNTNGTFQARLCCGQFCFICRQSVGNLKTHDYRLRTQMSRIKYSAPTLTKLMTARKQYSKRRSHSPHEFCKLYYGIQSLNFGTSCDKQDYSNIGHNEKSVCAGVLRTTVRSFVRLF